MKYFYYESNHEITQISASFSTKYRLKIEDLDVCKLIQMLHYLLNYDTNPLEKTISHHFQMCILPHNDSKARSA